MARFDVYDNPGSHATTTPFLLDVQSDLLAGEQAQISAALDFLFQGY